MSKDDNGKSSRLGTVGGQAVIEGVMMKHKENCSVAVRLENGGIKIINSKFISARKKFKPFNIPIIRGFVNFIEMMILSFKTLSVSADALGIEEEEGKFEKWLREKFGKSLVDIVVVISSVLGIALSFGLFFFLPSLAAKSLDSLANGSLAPVKGLIEGLLKILIFILYIWAVSFMKDIRRTFEYHGAEHKSIFCYEAGMPLTPENAKTYTRFHPRCGTSFIFVMLILSILIYSIPFIPWDNLLLRMVIKIALLPVIVGIGYEFIMYAGKHDNLFVKIVSAPGLWMQRLTTREPDLSQLEIAIAALKSAMPEEFPDFVNPSDMPSPDNAAPEADNGSVTNGEDSTGTVPNDENDKA